MKYNISGIYLGVCQNTTAGLEAEIILNLNIENDNVGGSLMIRGTELTGGGEIKGNLSGDKIYFSTPETEYYLPIQWYGEISTDTISGFYTVEPKNSLDYPKQEGVWNVEK